MGFALGITAVLACAGCPRTRYAEVAVADLPLFPGAHNVMHVRRPYGKGPPGPMNMILYRVDINYPSRDVLEIYVGEATKRGWRQVTPEADAAWDKTDGSTPSSKTAAEHMMSCRWVDAAQQREIGLEVFAAAGPSPGASGTSGNGAPGGGQRVSLAVRPYYSISEHEFQEPAPGQADENK